MDLFDEIRPYHDDEVRPVLDRLLSDPQFLNLMVRFKAPRLAESLPRLMRFWMGLYLQAQFRQVRSVESLQLVVAKYLQQTVDKTASDFTFSGLDRLARDQSYLFVSNHRDIVFDPALVNLALHRRKFATVRIAIGDNLLKSRLVAEMMRLNKSFIVKRNLSSPREMRDAFFTLSSYINHSIETGHSVWIAQQEGRAKNGLDRTDPAIIKMFHMSQKKADASFEDVMARLRIVPVAISYEYDPCDEAKAQELEERARTGQYHKSETEDIESIVAGITGFKGRVHVAFGSPLEGDLSSPKAVAAAIDHQIIRQYRLFPSNYLAYEQLRKDDPGLSLPPVEPDVSITELASSEPPFEQRLRACPPQLRRYLLEMYANPVISRQQLDA